MSREGTVTKPRRSIHEPGQAERIERRADLTVRIILWIVGGVVVVALALWFFLT
jgi:hypothetical protein